MSRVKVMCDNCENGRNLMSQQNQLLPKVLYPLCDVVALKMET